MIFVAISMRPTPRGVTRLERYVDPIDLAVGAADVDSVRDAVEGHLPELHGAAARHKGLPPEAVAAGPRVQLVHRAIARPDPQSSGAVVHRCPHVDTGRQNPDLIELPRRAGELDRVRGLVSRIDDLF